MTAATYAAAMIRVFADEGGFTNDPIDPGGATNWGITIFDARKYWKPTADANDVRNMPKSVASDIYRKHYADPMRYDDLPAGFDYSVLDAAINSGVGRAPVWAGKALGIPVKSINDVVAPANAANDKVSLIQRYWAARLSFLHSLRTWSHFGGGWGRRCAQGEAAAVRMWLSVGANMSGADARKKLDEESKKASGQGKKAGTGAATAGTGGAIAPAGIDYSSLTGKLLLALLLAGLGVLIVYLIRQAILHSQRAEAYAKA
jgi:lysozyme family protein